MISCSSIRSRSRTAARGAINNKISKALAPDCSAYIIMTCTQTSTCTACMAMAMERESSKHGAPLIVILAAHLVVVAAMRLEICYLVRGRAVVRRRIRRHAFALGAAERRLGTAHLARLIRRPRRRRWSCSDPTHEVLLLLLLLINVLVLVLLVRRRWLVVHHRLLLLLVLNPKQRRAAA